jgi:putative ABC transport system permease protein
LPAAYRQLTSKKFIMIKNYLKLAFRNLRRSKSFSFINIFGLAIGMTCCMLLIIYISAELNFDKHHPSASDIFLINTSVERNGEKEEFARLSHPYGPAFQKEFPEVEYATRLWDNIIESKTLIKYSDPVKGIQSFYETKGHHVDSNFFQVFSYQFSEGTAASAMASPRNIVLSEQVAKKFFGSEKALGKTLTISGTTGNDQLFTVSGVYKDETHRSHIDARFFVSLNAGWVGDFMRNAPADFANNNMFYTYVKLRPGTSPSQFTAKLPSFMDKYARKDLIAAGFDKKLSIIALPELHLYSGNRNIVSAGNSMIYIYILASIAAFILLIACINFMNLSTARSAKRAAEVGIRKVVGAGRNMLVKQFLGESVLLAMLALIVSYILAIVLLNSFNLLTNRNFTIEKLFELRMVVLFVLLAIATGLIAGSYPAFYLSVFNPVNVLKGKFVNSISATTLRKGLVIFQFVISIGLVLASIIIQEQMNYMQNQPLGFSDEQRVVVPLRSRQSHESYNTLRTAFLNNSNIVAAEGTNFYPGIVNPSDFSLYRSDQTVNDIQSVKTNWVSPEYLSMMGFEPVQGRLFSKDFPADTANKIIVNEATIKRFNIDSKNAIGTKLNFDWQGQTHSFEVIGVLKDFHFEALHQPIVPFAFLLNTAPDFNYVIVHVNEKNVSAGIAHLEKQWKTIRPDEPFEFSFLQEDFLRNYEADKRTSSIVNYFTVISILISCLGLFGLAAFAAQQRTKEIGVRKVLGASIGNITTLLSKDFIKLVAIAIVIACPVAWYSMHEWLKEFAYRTRIEWWVFVIAALSAILIALVTVSFQAIKAAVINPVKSLRSE